MKKVLNIFLILFLTCSGFAQGIAGTWYGTLAVPNGVKLHLVFHITKNGDTYTSTFDSPDQSAFGLSIDSTNVKGSQLIILASKYGIKYSGTYLPDSNKIKGTFTQGSGSLTLDLSTTKPSASIIPRRLQDPLTFPYHQEEITFTNVKGGDKLAGTLTMPSDGKATKIVILITGSGPQNRNEEIVQFNHRPFLVWSDWLTRKGIAVLRFDDRGIAKSTGDFNSATTSDFSDDVEAAVQYIKSRNDLDKLEIGLMGHSEGGMIAPMVASRDKAVKFIVLLAGPGVPIKELMLRQISEQLQLSGVSADSIKFSLSMNDKLFTYTIQHPKLTATALNQKIDSIIRYDLKYVYHANPSETSIEQMVTAGQALSSPWFRYFISFNPGDYLSKVKCPVLALDGTLDMQVNGKDNLAGIQSDLEKGGNQHFQVILLPDLNHLFQKATTGSVAEYSQIEETVDPVALQTVSDWIIKL
jgi:alpha/beta superfamily hydrolase